MAEILTKAEVMAALGLRDEATLRRWERRGVGPPCFRVGRKHSRLFFPKAAFEEWLRERVDATEAEYHGVDFSMLSKLRSR